MLQSGAGGKPARREQNPCLHLVTYLNRGQWRNARSSRYRTGSPPVPAPVQVGGGGGGRRVRQSEGQGGRERQRAGQRGRAEPSFGALLLLLGAKVAGGGDGQGMRERVRWGAAGPSATGVWWTQGGRRCKGQRQGWRQRARPGAGGVTHGLSEGLEGGSGRDLHAGLLPSGYALPPSAMICRRRANVREDNSNGHNSKATSRGKNPNG